MFPFFFQPFISYRRNQLQKLNTTSITTSDTMVTLNVNERVWMRLPNEGLILLVINSTADDTAADLPVQINLQSVVSLIKADGDNVTGSEIVSGARYLTYYNKSNNILQILV